LYPDERLHPSWEAKRKQKVALDSFQGKKIKFDEQDFSIKKKGNPVQSNTGMPSLLTGRCILCVLFA